MSASLPPRVYADHVIAPATTEALTKIVNIPALVSRQLDFLELKQNANTTFGPLLLRHAGDIRRHRNDLSATPNDNALDEKND